MKRLLYRKKQSLKRRRKAISNKEYSEDKECKTRGRKSFVQKVSRVNEVEQTDGKPEIFINKKFDKKSQQEEFSFRVKGTFFMTREQSILKVTFCHTLRIDIHWKSKVFSPKKSVTLT